MPHTLDNALAFERTRFRSLAQGVGEAIMFESLDDPVVEKILDVLRDHGITIYAGPETIATEIDD